MNSSENPWEVENIEDFLFFCCPTCDKKICGQKRDIFLEHAFSQHPESKESLEELIASEQQIDEEFEDKNHEFEINEKMEMDSENKSYNHEIIYSTVKEELDDGTYITYNEYNEAQIEEVMRSVNRILCSVLKNFEKLSKKWKKFHSIFEPITRLDSQNRYPEMAEPVKLTSEP